MKKLIVFCLLLGAFQVQAQDRSVTYGVKAGANFSNLKIDFDGAGISPDGATNIFVGGYVDVGVAEKLNFQPELQYSIEGAKDASVSFINLPLMLKYYLVEGFNLQAGPQIGFVVDAEGGDTDGLKSTNFVLNIGAAYELPAGFFADARYNFGLSNIAEEEPGFEDVGLKTKGFQLGVGYRF